jgi:hypothetical protein
MWERKKKRKREQEWRKESSKIIALLNTFSPVMFDVTLLQA